MCDNIFPDNSIEIIAGDDFTVNVDFTFDGENAIFEDGDTAEMLIHGDNEDIHIKAKLYENNTASFYLSSELTKALLREDETESYYEYCICVNWAYSGRHTPIHRKTLTVKRC